MLYRKGPRVVVPVRAGARAGAGAGAGARVTVRVRVRTEIRDTHSVAGGTEAWAYSTRRHHLHGLKE